MEMNLDQVSKRLDGMANELQYLANCVTDKKASMTLLDAAGRVLDAHRVLLTIELTPPQPSTT
jgi:hypothetical protein